MDGLKAFVAVLVFSIVVCSCRQDFRSLPGGYSLERFDEGPTVYYVDAPGREAEPGGGAFDGIIQEIGWNKDLILARVKRLSAGDPDGWYVLNVKTREITGPFNAAQIRANPTLSSIETWDPDEVFSGEVR
jgi:hypothetical protein